ncbi:MAG: tRNA preQ1(34) S-adenosylmethionine ribosyltransferase-isomerase QueA [Nitrospinae bacterium]|nr:tRNA preQ1(34) S-adenosylmethionine ribosyltransferase-isomerase QueA [Nitrospinota bacterium]
MQTHLSDFDFELPAELIAQKPAQKRDQSRLLVVDRKKNTLFHDVFSNLIQYLRFRPLMVFNNTQVIPAKIFGILPHNEKMVELILVRPVSPAIWEVLMKGKMKPETKIAFPESSLTGKFIKRNGERAVIEFSSQTLLENHLKNHGRMPLPPYIRRMKEDSPLTREEDKIRYQTVYASQSGAIAAPTAGLHFTKAHLNKLKSNQVEMAHLTLHVGPGTFKPIRTEDYSKHEMEAEAFRITPKNWNHIFESKKKGRSILAVGTTSTRVLETQEFKKPIRKTQSGWTNCFIVPGWDFKNVDHLLTNFHLPKSTLYLLVSAFCGQALASRAYQEAIGKKYRFFSYGDAMLIL